MLKYIAILAVALIPLLTMGVVHHQPSEATDGARCDAAVHARDVHGVTVWCRAVSEDFDLDAARETGDDKAADLLEEATSLSYVAAADYALKLTNRPTGDSVCAIFQTAQSLYSKAQESATSPDIIRLINNTKIFQWKAGKTHGC